MTPDGWFPYFRDRADAGRRLAAALADLRDARPVILAVPRGGVAVAAEVARALDAPLDVMVARKLGAPGQPELAIGATTARGDVVLDPFLIRELEVPEQYVEAERRRQSQAAQEQEQRFRRARPPVGLEGRTAVLVDDGLATGATMEAAVRTARRLGAGAVVVAVPVASTEGAARMRRLADRFVSLHTPPDFGAVGAYYREFRQVPDEEVVRLLEESRGRAG
ncbi:MAG TPA: phosphoribosyltransferase family protein [Dehalococcoidia bacterium]